MRSILVLLLLVTSAVTSQNKNVNTKKGVAVNGYDVVAYFYNEPNEGLKEFSKVYEGVTYKFSTKNNLDKFIKNPKKYIPEYGGYCAYAIGLKGKKVSINPETFEIRDGKLYLFYNKGKTNTLNLWLHNNPEKLQKQADKNWQKFINK
ncbi:YHS domain-containing (seleno)protein [Polaribacter marinivivus]|uniref:YHS domain-containing (seleno)protein n=1 Tax=Polaribacter marinivivus TaxID=1524260 RepID=UPI003D341FB8